MMDVSVDDRRALWALTTRHLRSRTFGAVLLVRSALRARAQSVDITTRGDILRVADDGAARDDEIAAILQVLDDPSVGALHSLEARFGTDLLVTLATAKTAIIESGSRRAYLAAGVVERIEPLADAHATTTTTTVTLGRPRALRREERRELDAWLPGPRATVRVDGRPWKRQLHLPESAFFARAFKTDSGHGLIGFSLDDATSKTTVLSRGLWVAQDAARPRGLPLIAIWDDDDVTAGSTAADTAVARARVAVERAGQALQRRLAEEFDGLPARRRVKLRSLLLRSGTLPPAFHDVPLFDRFRVSLAELSRRPRIVIGSANADVIVDDEARAFLHRALPTQVKDALPPPRRRLGYALRRLVGGGG